MAEQEFHKAVFDDLDEELGLLDEMSQRGDVPWLRLEFGEHNIRILPAFNESGRWFRRYGQYFEVPIGGKKLTYTAPSLESPPEPDLLAQYLESIKDTDRDKYYQYRASVRFDFNVAFLDEDGNVLEGDDGAPKVGVLSLPPSAARPILEAAKRHGDPTDPEDGYNFMIRKKKTGPKQWDVDYTVMPDRDNTPLSDWGILEHITDLEEIRNVPSLEEQKEMLNPSDDDVKEIEAADEELMESGFSDDDETEESEEPLSPKDLLAQRIGK